jgi:hypothetical protein
MISIYSSAFNLIKNNFDFVFSINNFCNFANEVVIAVNTSEDDTLSSLINLTNTYKNLKIISTNFSYEDPLLDGKIKNESLQNTTQSIKIGLDMDEYIPLRQKSIWLQLAQQLKNDDCYCYMIPSINLYKDYDHYFSITPKWYIHKSGLFRGPVNFARKNNGTIDTSKSDSCELIDDNGNLVSSKIAPYHIDDLRTGLFPFVVHTGYLSLENRLLRNKNFWSDHWLKESGGEKPPHKIHEKLEDFDYNIQQHALKI